MSSPYVCSRCSRRLFRPKGQFRTAGFVSLSRLVDREGVSKARIQEEEVVKIESTRSEAPRRKKRLSFAQQYQEQRKPFGVDRVLETLFSSSRAHENAGHVSRYSRAPKEEKSKEEELEYTANNRSISIDHRLLELHKQLQRGTSRLEYIWASCQQLLREKAWTHHKRRDTASVVFRDILLAICSKQQILVHDTIVTPVSVIELYRKHGVMKDWWSQAIWAHLGRLTLLKHDTSDTNSKKDPDPTHLIMQNLLEVWYNYAARYQISKSAIHLGGDNGRPITSNRQLIEGSSSKSALHQFLYLVPKHRHTTQAESMVAGAIVTLNCLEENAISCSPLLGDFFKKIRQAGDLDIATARNGLSEAGVASDIIGKEFERWGISISLPSHEGSLTEKTTSKPTMGLDWSPKSIASRFADIDGMARRLDAKLAVSLWESYLDYLESVQSDDKEANDRIFASFLGTFWAIHRSDLAVDVWNYMVKSGRTLNQFHWNAMLVGCVRGRDISSLQEIWANMCRSKITPDISCWTTYIHGLIILSKWQQGLEALDLFGKTWKETPVVENPNPPSVPQSPDSCTTMLAPVHGALSALRDIDKPELMSTVMAWAQSKNLQLVTLTFNILLKSLARTGTQAQIQSHLAQMADHKCAPDVRTFTIMLGALVTNKNSSFLTLPSEIQESTIISRLRDMENQGIPPNQHTYTTLIYGLLGDDDEEPPRNFTIKGTQNVPTARTILRYMQKRKMIPSVHLYTVLFNHYFESTPPEIPAIDSLWASILHSGHTKVLDSFFYSRMVIKYADIDEFEKALQFLRHMLDEGKSPSWRALYRVISALERAREWGLCSELVSDVEDTERGLLKHGTGSYLGKKEFYDVVDNLRMRGILAGGEEQV